MEGNFDYHNYSVSFQTGDCKLAKVLVIIKCFFAPPPSLFFFAGLFTGLRFLRNENFLSV